MSKVGNVQYELLAIKKLIESKNPELIAKLKQELFSNVELSNIVKISGLLYADNGQLPGWDLLSAELTNRIINPDKQKFYVDLLQDIKDKDATGITTDDLIDKLRTQRQFRFVLDGAGKLVDAVDRRDADSTVGIMRELYEDMFKNSGEDSLDDADMVSMAGTSVKYNFEKTGFTGIDKRGGHIEGGLFGYAGAAKAGKSVVAQQITVYGHDNYEGSSCYYSYEQTAAEIRARILSARSEIDVGLVTSDILTPEERLRLREAEVAHLCDFNANMKDFCYQTRGESEKEFWPSFWTHFEPRKNRFLIPKKSPDWDNLFIQMQILVDMKNVRRFVIDYPTIVPRGRSGAKLASWEYALQKSQELKDFARNNGVRIIIPMQYDDKNDHIRYNSGVINAVDLLVAMKMEEGDTEFGDSGATTFGFKAYRNFLSVPGEPTLQPFKALRNFKYAKFENFDF